MDYPEQLADLAGREPELAAELADVRSLEQVLNWMGRKGWPLASLDMITQDEYSHDLLLPLPGTGRWLAFGMT